MSKNIEQNGRKNNNMAERTENIIADRQNHGQKNREQNRRQKYHDQKNREQ